MILRVAPSPNPGDRFIRSGSFTGWHPELCCAGRSDRTCWYRRHGRHRSSRRAAAEGFDANLLYFDRRHLSRSMNGTESFIYGD